MHSTNKFTLGITLFEPTKMKYKAYLSGSTEVKRHMRSEFCNDYQCIAL